MNGRYPLKLGWRIFILIMAPALIGLFSFLLFILFNQKDTPLFVLIGLTPVCMAMIGLMLYGIGDAIFGYYEIGDDFVAHRTIFGKKVVPLSDIKGVNFDRQYISLLPKPGKKGIKITQYARKSELLSIWALSNFEEMHSERVEREDIEVLKEVTEDIPAAEHDDRLKKAKRTSKYLNVLGYGIGLWFLCYPQPSYDTLAVASMLVPVIIMIAIWRSKGFLRFNGQDKSRYPIIVMPLMMPIAALGLRTILDFEILDYGDLWLQSLGIAVALEVVAMWVSKEFSFRTLLSGFTTVFYFGVFYAYAICSLTIINCRFDSSQSQTFKAAVLGKEISDGKTTTYYLDLAPWGPRTEHERVSVSRSDFQRAIIGDTAKIYVYDGRLNAKWFEIGVK